MAGEKNNAVVAVISGLTQKQASKITTDIMDIKAKHAPYARGTATNGIFENVGNMLQGSFKKLGGK